MLLLIFTARAVEIGRLGAGAGRHAPHYKSEAIRDVRGPPSMSRQRSLVARHSRGPDHVRWLAPCSLRPVRQPYGSRQEAGHGGWVGQDSLLPGSVIPVASPETRTASPPREIIRPGSSVPRLRRSGRSTSRVF
jgi:hypothetical protein